MKIIIIGGGIAGLSAGVYGQLTGHDTSIYEMHTAPGGVCTGWRRKDYYFEGCIHWLIGTKPGDSMRKVWDDLGALDGKTITDYEVFREFRDPLGRSFKIYCDAEKLRMEILKHAPEDKKGAAMLYRDIRSMEKFAIPAIPQWQFRLGDYINKLPMLPLMGRISRLGKISWREYTNRFSNPFVRESLYRLFGIEDFPAAGAIMTLGSLHNKNAGWPEGGGLGLAHSIYNRYLSLGGDFHGGKKVERILVRRGKAYGIRLTDGTEVPGDVIISAADGHTTLFDMLEGKYLTSKLKQAYESYPLFDPLVQVSFGLSSVWTEVEHSITRCCDPYFNIGSDRAESIFFRRFPFEPNAAPEGHDVAQIIYNTHWDRWKNMQDRGDEYRREKEKITRDSVKALELFLPGAADHIQAVDVATPVTTVRYTGNWKASFEGFNITRDTFMSQLPHKLPGLKRFYMIGQWTTPGGGLPPAALDGKGVIMEIDRRRMRKFR